MRAPTAHRSFRTLIDTARDCGIALRNDIGWHILYDNRPTANHGVRTDANKLVIPGMAAQDGPITHFAVAGQLRIAGQNGLVADLTIMRDVHITHNPVVGPNGGDALVLSGTDMKADKLANRIAVTNFQTRGFTTVFLVLGDTTKRSIMMNFV